MSVLRSYAQVAPRVHDLYVPADSNYGGFTAVALAARVAGNAANVKSFDGSMLNAVNAGDFLNGIANPVALVTKEVYRDLGKELVVLENGVKVAVFRYAQKISDDGPLHEGVGESPNIYICTWQSAGGNCPSRYAMVKVVRTG